MRNGYEKELQELRMAMSNFHQATTPKEIEATTLEWMAKEIRLNKKLKELNVKACEVVWTSHSQEGGGE